jgi:hypothetical protein
LKQVLTLINTAYGSLSTGAVDRASSHLRAANDLLEREAATIETAVHRRIQASQQRHQALYAAAAAQPHLHSHVQQQQQQSPPRAGTAWSDATSSVAPSPMSRQTSSVVVVTPSQPPLQGSSGQQQQHQFNRRRSMSTTQIVSVSSAAAGSGVPMASPLTFVGSVVTSVTGPPTGTSSGGAAPPAASTSATVLESSALAVASPKLNLGPVATRGTLHTLVAIQVLRAAVDRLGSLIAALNDAVAQHNLAHGVAWDVVSVNGEAVSDGGVLSGGILGDYIPPPPLPSAGAGAPAPAATTTNSTGPTTGNDAEAAAKALALHKELLSNVIMGENFGPYFARCVAPQ